MISMRYHIVSIAAVFLALALGIVLGATKINSPLLVGLQSDRELADRRARSALDGQQDARPTRVASDDTFAGSVGTLAVRGTLPGAVGRGDHHAPMRHRPTGMPSSRC